MPQLMDSAAVLNACSGNIDLEWLSHFLHDYGFLYWDMRQSVRGNRSKAIDLIWRECIAFMHGDVGHKTQYAPIRTDGHLAHLLVGGAPSSFG